MAVPRYRSANAWPLFTLGFRPFFFMAGLWAVVSMLLWVLMLRGAIELPTAFDPITWHFHELLFGFVAATIAGFLLTAIPNWTGRLPLQGFPLATLVLIWLLGRAAVATSAWIGPVAAAIADIAFLAALFAVVAREILAGRNWRNLPVLIAVAFLIVANALIHLGAIEGTNWLDIGKRFAISIVIMLISLIGGRIIPSFTANWLRRQGASALPVPFNSFDKATLGISLIALAGWTVFDLAPTTGALLIAAAVAQAVRLSRWRGIATAREPLVWILHVGYAWLPVGLALLGLAAWMPEFATTAIHALTAGAMGTMILAVMTRASLGHSKRELTAGMGTVAIYLLVLLATVARIVAPFLDAGYSAALDLAGTAWIAAFALFAVLYLPLYVRR